MMQIVSHGYPVNELLRDFGEIGGKALSAALKASEVERATRESQSDKLQHVVIVLTDNLRKGFNRLSCGSPIYTTLEGGLDLYQRIVSDQVEFSAPRV